MKAVLAQADDPKLSLAQKAARARRAREFSARVEAAISTVHDLLEDRKPSAPAASASTTDAEARVMKMGDGGFRPAMNVRCATAGSELGGPRTVIAVEVTNVGSDMGALTPMLAQIEARTGELPTTVLADANHANHEAIAHMDTAEAKRLYRARAGLSEWTNAQFAGRFQLRQFLVRGLDKATSVALLCAITSNLSQRLATLAS